MSRFKRRIVILGTLSVVGVAVGMMRPADARWQTCPENPGHVAYNPVTGGSVKVGHEEHVLWGPGQLMWAWACVDDGGTTGAHSVGTAGYYNLDPTEIRYHQHGPVCPDVAFPSCTEVHAGAGLYNIDTQSPNAGATMCASLVVTSIGQSPCEDVRVTVGSTSPASTTTRDSAGGPGDGLCGVAVNGTCTLKEVTVTAGGTTVSVAASGTVNKSESETVPKAMVCVNQGGATKPAEVLIPPGTCS